MKHISLDTESLSLNENPALLSIGAVVFDPHGNDTVESFRAAQGFSIVLDLKDQVEGFGRHIDGGTVMWWLRQSKEAQQQVISDKPSFFTGALLALSAWITQHGGQEARLWTHGAAEDAVWLRSAFRAAFLPFPIHYRNIRDTRTLFELADAPEIIVPGLVNHVALDDAIYQALRIQHAYQHLVQLKEAA